MVQRSTIIEAQKRTVEILSDAGISITPEERENIEIVEFGLGNLESEGLQIITYENNNRYCAKELIMFPRQTCCEHRHPNVGERSGKMETFRCRTGEVYLYITGTPATDIKAVVPKSNSDYYTVFHEILLQPGEQYTIPPNTLHWFQAGPDGAVVSEFSSTSMDESDIFTNPNIIRIPEIVEDV